MGGVLLRGLAALAAPPLISEKLLADAKEKFPNIPCAKVAEMCKGANDVTGVNRGGRIER